MNNKGFTLIELIVTIALLAIILTISFVSITAVINSNKEEQCNNLVNSIKSASEEYVSDNRYNSEFIKSVRNKSITIDGSVLVNNNYLNGTIINPFNNEEIVSNSIKITITLNNDYTVSSISIDEPAVLKECKNK